MRQHMKALTFVTLVVLALGTATPPSPAAANDREAHDISATQAASTLTWVKNVAVLSPNNWVTVKVPLDGRKRPVLLKCGASEGEACGREDLRVNGKVVLRTTTGEASLISAVHRVLRFPGKNGLIAVSVQQYSIDQAKTWTPEATYSGKLYRYHKGKLILVRDLWKDHRRLATGSDVAYNDEGRWATRSFIKKIVATGQRFTVTWETIDWSCTNIHPSASYKYSKGKVSLVSHTTVGPCA